MVTSSISEVQNQFCSVLRCALAVWEGQLTLPLPRVGQMSEPSPCDEQGHHGRLRDSEGLIPAGALRTAALQRSHLSACIQPQEPDRQGADVSRWGLEEAIRDSEHAASMA